MSNKIKAVMIGHAIGDALGVPVEFCTRAYLKSHPVMHMKGSGTYDVPAGCWSDDTSMSLCALESLAKGKMDYDNIMENFVKWYYDKEFTATGVVFDIGNTCYYAIQNYIISGNAAVCCGLADEMSNGNGSLMRIHPFVLYAFYNDINNSDFTKMIIEASSLTHAHFISTDGCIIYAHILRSLLDNPSKDSVYRGLNAAACDEVYSAKYYHRLLNQDIGKLDETFIKSSGYVVDTLEAAIWCLLTTENYSDCVLKAVNLGGDADTIAAISGGLAGALYGIDAIPNEWTNKLKRKDYIESMCMQAHNTWRKNET